MHPDTAKLQRSPRDTARWRKAQEKLLGGRHAAALVDYRDLARRFPGVAELWFELGNAAAGELDFPLANQAYRRALELAPDNSSLISLIGHQFQSLRQLSDARASTSPSGWKRTAACLRPGSRSRRASPATRATTRRAISAPSCSTASNFPAKPKRSCAT